VFQYIDSYPIVGHRQAPQLEYFEKLDPLYVKMKNSTARRRAQELCNNSGFIVEE